MCPNRLFYKNMDERLLHDVQRYRQRGLSQSAITQKLEGKGFTPEAIQRAWKQVRAASLLTEKEYVEKTWALRLFRFGFAGVFLINALVAWLQPQDFLGLMQKSLAINWLGSLEWLIPVIALNDLAIGIVILAAPKRYRPYVYAWTGLWFLAITVIKLTALNVFTS
jgi:DNA-binding transcriptional MerR regulator